jgi:hypothetical protein
MSTDSVYRPNCWEGEKEIDGAESPRCQQRVPDAVVCLLEDRRRVEGLHKSMRQEKDMDECAHYNVN